MRQSTSTVEVKMRMKKEKWVNRGQCPQNTLFFPPTHLKSLHLLKILVPSHRSVRSSIINVPGESTLRRDFLRLQLANKERSEAQRRQQLEQQQNEEHKRLLLAERQKRIEEQKEQRRRLEEVRWRRTIIMTFDLVESYLKNI